jgi:hypothetical protein
MVTVWLNGRALALYWRGHEFELTCTMVVSSLTYDVEIGSDCSFAKSLASRSKNHGSFGYDLKNKMISFTVRILAHKSHRCLAYSVCQNLQPFSGNGDIQI